MKCKQSVHHEREGVSPARTSSAACRRHSGMRCRVNSQGTGPRCRVNSQGTGCQPRSHHTPCNVPEWRTSAAQRSPYVPEINKICVQNLYPRTISSRVIVKCPHETLLSHCMILYALSSHFSEVSHISADTDELMTPPRSVKLGLNLPM